MQLLERLQYHIDKLDEGHYFWDTNETGGKLECVFDPTPNELQNFLKDYPICKAVSNGYGNWVFAYGQKICHDTLDGILEHAAKVNHWPIKFPRYIDDHLSVTRQGQILGSREANSFEQSLSLIFDWGDGESVSKKERMEALEYVLKGLKSLRSKYPWFKPSPSLIEEIKALRSGRPLKDNSNGEFYRW